MQEIKYWLLYGKAKCNILQWKIQCFKQFSLSRIFRILHKNKSSKTCEYQLDEFDDNLVRNDHENNHVLTPPKIKLIIAGETMQCRKVRHILRYHVSNKLLAPEEFAHHVLFLFFCSEMKKNCYQVFHHCTKQTARVRSPGCYKYEQNKTLAKWGFSWSGFLSI